MLSKFSYGDIMKAANSGDSYLQTLIGFLHQHGLGCIADNATAETLYRQAAA